MPQVIIRGLKEQEVCDLSGKLCKKLAKTMETEPDWFLFEHINSKAFCQGVQMKKDVIVDVLWFNRGQEIQDKSAQDISFEIKKLGYGEVTVVFHALEKQSYYENGEHY